MMKNFYGTNKKKAYFEGWYLKHQNQQQTVALIPSYHVDDSGGKFASLQIITNTFSRHIPYAAEDFFADKRRFAITLGANIFSRGGIYLNVQRPEFSLTGRIFYGPFQTLDRDIMGPFRCVPGMQCRHGILSMEHRLFGYLRLNGSLINFQGGTGYIEKDWGCSFPKSYLWTQCNRFGEKDCRIFASVADIPLCGGHFTGCICDICYEDKHYRIATYSGARARLYNDQKMELKQGAYTLTADLIDANPRPLLAPRSGAMARTIHESAACTVRYRFYRENQCIFDLVSPQAAFEYAGCEAKQSACK